MALIEAVNAREILDSRGNPTVEVEVLLDDGIVQRAAVPSGASTGAFEAYELRDGDKTRYSGKGVLKAVAAVIDELGPAIEGVDASEQRIIDEILIEVDGTDNKGRVGANAILGVSLAVAKAAADSADLPLFRYLGGPNAHILPVPLFNVINGGSHADNGIDMQEFFLAPIGASTFAEALRWGTETYHVLKAELLKAGYATGLGDEGGFAPDLPSNREGLDFLITAIEKAGFTPGTEIALGMDVAATEFFKDGSYVFEGKNWTAEAAHRLLRRARRRVPDRDDRGRARRGRLGRLEAPHREARLEDPARRRRPLRDQPRCGCATASSAASRNSLLVKVNQIGTLSETLDAVDMAHRAGYTTMFSHRSGETEDTTIADLVRRGELGSDQERRARSKRARREIQSASAHRG